jgi:hemolysin activation/secretion protein
MKAFNIILETLSTGLGNFKRPQSQGMILIFISPLTTVLTTALGAQANDLISQTNPASDSLPNPSFLKNSPPQPEPSPPFELPPAQQLLQTKPQGESPVPSPGSNRTITVKKFQIEGSTIFTEAALQEPLKKFLDHPLTFADLVAARDLITKLYTDRGYTTSGAYLPENQPFQDGTIIIQVLEGVLGKINLNNQGHLGNRYIQNQIRRFARAPLNVNQLVQGLQLLQLDPLIKTLSAELTPSTRPGESLLNVDITQNPSFRTYLNFDNGRSPSVGSQRQQIRLREETLLGQHDAIEIGYSLTSGSQDINLNYTIPLTPSNTTASIFYSSASANVIEKPFDGLDIRSQSRDWEFTFRQPIIQSPVEELAVGLTFSHRFSQTRLQGRFFPLSPGANPQDGSTRLSVIRLFQDWNRQNGRQVISIHSQFNIGTSWFGANRGLPGLTGSEAGLDGQFVSWQGQAQYARALPLKSLLLARLNTQFTPHTLLGLEQFGLGGLGSVRGYRQDSVLSDNGIFASTELRIPFAQIPEGQFAVSPFLDYGVGWNNGDIPDPAHGHLASTGFGILFDYKDRVTARLDWGIPLLQGGSGKSLQESGITFSLQLVPLVF